MGLGAGAEAGGGSGEGVTLMSGVGDTSVSSVGVGGGMGVARGGELGGGWISTSMRDDGGVGAGFGGRRWEWEEETEITSISSSHSKTAKRFFVGTPGSPPTNAGVVIFFGSRECDGLAFPTTGSFFPSSGTPLTALNVFTASAKLFPKTFLGKDGITAALA